MSYQEKNRTAAETPPEQLTPDFSGKTIIIMMFVSVILSAAALIVIGALAYPAWELLRLGWNFLA